MKKGWKSARGWTIGPLDEAKPDGAQVLRDEHGHQRAVGPAGFLDAIIAAAENTQRDMYMQDIKDRATAHARSFVERCTGRPYEESWDNPIKDLNDLLEREAERVWGKPR